jgi:hypothetical protein
MAPFKVFKSRAGGNLPRLWVLHCRVCVQQATYTSASAAWQGIAGHEHRHPWDKWFM